MARPMLWTIRPEGVSARTVGSEVNLKYPFFRASVAFDWATGSSGVGKHLGNH
jgi:hypothetical protein